MRFVGCSWFFNVIIRGLGGLIIPDGKLMIPDRLQYILNDFWIDQKCDQIWSLGPRIYYENT